MHSTDQSVLPIPMITHAGFPAVGILAGGALVTFIGVYLNVTPPLGAYFIPVDNTSGLQTLYGYALSEFW